jgi:putative transposase
MRKSRFTESQIVGILKDGDDVVPLADLVRKHGISRATYFNRLSPARRDPGR